MGNIRLAVHAITWGGSGLQQAVEDISSQGFRGIETFDRVVQEYAGREQEFDKLLSDHGLRLVSLYGGGNMHLAEQRDEVIARNERLAKFLSERDAKPLTLGPGRRSPGGTTSDELREMAKTMNEIGKRAQEYGVIACLHPHWGTTIQERDEIDRIFELVDPDYVQMNADPAHMAKAGYDPVEVFRTYASIIKYCHFKDYLKPEEEKKAIGEGGTAIIPDFVEFGVGTIDLPGLVQVLKDSNYDGWMTVELDQSIRGPLESLKMNRQYLEERLGLKADQDNVF
jgi:inosose dehydratase